MGGGRAFLMLKGFHPENFQNQKRLWLAEEKQKQEEAARREADETYMKEQQRVANNRLLSGRDEPEKNELGFMYAAPPGLKQQQEKEEQEQARQQQLDNINLGDDREKFLQSIANAPREGAHVDPNATTVQPFGVDPGIVKAAQRANQKLARGEMGGTDNPFVSHRSGAMDNVQLKNQEWAVNHDYVTDTSDGMAQTEAADEAAYLASLSKKDRKLLAKYTQKLSGPSGAGGAVGAIGKERKKHKKEKHKKKSRKKKHKKHKKRYSSESSSS